jgi:hypothetical protein
MNLDDVRRVADAVLYEGYILYPYRASAQKNRSRWQFGVLMPPAYAAIDPSERSTAQAECVFEHHGAPAVTVIARFLQVQRRTARDAVWDEAVAREVTATADLDGVEMAFEIPGGEERDGDVVRRRTGLLGSVSLRARPLPGPWRAARLTVQLANRTVACPAPSTRDQALPSALVAAHLIITVSGGAFVSMTSPPQWAAAEVAGCENIAVWPVLAGPDGGREAMLASPIILPDHPEVAPESAGELYDGTEIDEILTLRTLALTDAEKLEARATDERAAALLDRVESMEGEAMTRLHGTFREVHHEMPWWDPEADAAVSPGTDTVTIGGQRVARGSRVTLRPGVRRADAQDMFLTGRPAVVEAVLLDVDCNPYLAVSLADDPDADLRAAHGRFLYFAPDEVEP